VEIFFQIIYIYIYQITILPIEKNR
jgi:hypothetical protein